MVLLAAATFTDGQTTSASDYLAPIPAPANAPCEDTALDCMDVCGCDESGIDLACRLSSPIGEYLRYADLTRIHHAELLCLCVKQRAKVPYNWL